MQFIYHFRAFWTQFWKLIALLECCFLIKYYFTVCSSILQEILALLNDTNGWQYTIVQFKKTNSTTIFLFVQIILSNGIKCFHATMLVGKYKVSLINCMLWWLSVLSIYQPALPLWRHIKPHHIMQVTRCM